jgi:hypothetical protein
LAGSLLLLMPDRAAALDPVSNCFSFGSFAASIFPRMHQHGPLFNYGPYYGYYPFQPYGPWNAYLQYDPNYYASLGYGKPPHQKLIQGTHEHPLLHHKHGNTGECGSCSGSAATASASTVAPPIPGYGFQDYAARYSAQGSNAEALLRQTVPTQRSADTIAVSGTNP